MHSCNSPSRTSLVMVFFFGDEWGSRGLFYFYCCWEVAFLNYFCFLFLFLLIFLVAFRCLGFYQLAFLLHHPSSSFPSTIHDPTIQEFVNCFCSSPMLSETLRRLADGGLFMAGQPA